MAIGSIELWEKEMASWKRNTNTRLLKNPDELSESHTEYTKYSRMDHVGVGFTVAANPR